MIHVDTAEVRPPARWKRQANKLSAELQALPDKKRPAFIEKHSRVWRSMQGRLATASHGKCWYCETKNTRADLHVDHHRPKNRIMNSDGTKGQGYWWLAFDLENFRLACSYCNCLHKGQDGITRGKSDKFPLLRYCKRAKSKSELAKEMPILLDPVVHADPSFLWFREDGRVTPAFSRKDRVLYTRAKSTIDILNLDESRIVQARKDLWSLCTSFVDIGNIAINDYATGRLSGKNQFEIAYRRVKALIKPSSEFSATARACFSGYADENKWVKKALQSG
jgi:uncharacterized protein (TIGR02646 family)